MRPGTSNSRPSALTRPSRPDRLSPTRDQGGIPTPSLPSPHPGQPGPGKEFSSKITMKGKMHKKLGFFITQLIEPSNGTRAYIHTSRRTRKGLKKLSVDLGRHGLPHPINEFSSLFTFKPRLLTWWIAILFMLGSACFVGGSFGSLYLKNVFSPFSINLTFFTGSLFFTSAAYGQYLEVINADITNAAYSDKKKMEWIWWAWRPKNLGFTSSTCQLAGTILFNINTFNCFYTGLSYVAEEILIWLPNLAGSILFLIASIFAWMEIFHDKQIKRFRSASWWIIWVNLLGSVLFQRSAFRSFIHLDSGEAVNEMIALDATLYGAVCFFIGAYLLIVEMNEPEQVRSDSA